MDVTGSIETRRVL